MTQKFIYEKLIDTLKSDGAVATSDVVHALVDLEVKLQSQTYFVSQLREGLKFYLPGPFWDTVLKDTKADEDRGKHAEYILRLTDPDAA